MDKNKIITILKKIFFLSAGQTVLIAIPAYGLVIAALTGCFKNPAIIYFSYILSAYALIITITGFGKIKKAARNMFWKFPLIKLIQKSPIGARYLKDSLFRAQISLYVGLLINVAYIVMKIYIGITTKANWFIVFGFYYTILAVMKFILLSHIRGYGIRENIESEWKRYRTCGMILFLLNFALISIVVMILFDNRHFEYPGITIYGIALYTFYAVISAFVSLIKFRKHGSPVMSAAKAINFVVAMVSMLALETAMLVQFGKGDEAYAKSMNTATGVGVILIVIGIAVYMIRNADRQLEKMEGR